MLSICRRQLEAGGIRSVSITGAATEAGVTGAAPYRHFRDKAALLNALAALGFDELESQFLTVEGDSADERLREVALVYLRFAEQNPELFRLMLASTENDGAVSFTPSAMRRLAARMEAIAEAAPMRMSVERAARLAWATVHGIAMLRLNGIAGFGDGYDEAAVRDDLDSIIRFLHR